MVKGKYINFIQSNIRYSKYQIFIVAFLFIIASALINTFLFLSFHYNNSFAVEKERLNGEDVDLLFVDVDTANLKTDRISEILYGISEIKDAEVDCTVAGNGAVEFKDGRLTLNVTYMNLTHAKEKEIGRYEILESDGGSGVYLSYLFEVEGGYQIGDEITVTLGVFSDTFRVAGFYNNVDTGTVNCTDTVFLLTDDCYDKVASYGISSYRVSILANEPDSADKLESVALQNIQDDIPTLVPLRSSNAIRLSSSRYITSSIFQAIISLTAVLMIAVLLAIVAITLTNYIRNNMKNLGTLKAIGYQSGNLITSIVAEFSVIALVMSAAGVAISYLLLPALNTALERQVGIPYQIRFMPYEALISVAVCVVAAAMTSFISVIRIRRIAPILAIRETGSKKSAANNYFPLDKTHFKLNTALSLKSWLAGKIRNIVIFFSITGVAFLLGYSCFIYQNIVVDSNSVMSLIYGNTTDSVLNISTADEEQLKEKLQNDEDVERFYLYTVTTVTPQGLPKMYSFVYDDAKDLDEEQLTIKGHLPKKSGEIAVNGAYAAKNGLKEGDILRLTSGEETISLTVCGISQGASYSGNDCYLTRDGYSEIHPLLTVSYYVDLKDGKDIDEFNREIKDECRLLNSINFRETSDTTSESYKNVLSMSTLIVVVISLIIAGFILYVLISVYLSNKKREHGILKSLGFVTRDIIFQTVVSILPTCVLATSAGLLLSRNGAAKLLILAVRNLGIFSFGSPTSVTLLLIAGVGVTVFCIGYSLLLSNSVRTITPHQLFNKE